MTELWHKYARPPKDALKNFKRPGGFTGTAIDPMWMIQCATAEWGEYGIDWEADIITDEFVPGPEDLGILHYMVVMVRGAVGVGCTPLVGKNKYGPFLDEECPKKTFTDALTNALSKKGFAHAIYMGQYDGNKYITPPPENKSTETVSQNPLTIPDTWNTNVQKLFRSIFEELAGEVGQDEAVERLTRLLEYGDDWGSSLRVMSDEESKAYYSAVSEMVENIKGDS